MSRLAAYWRGEGPIDEALWLGSPALYVFADRIPFWLLDRYAQNTADFHPLAGASVRLLYVALIYVPVLVFWGRGLWRFCALPENYDPAVSPWRGRVAKLAVLCALCSAIFQLLTAAPALPFALRQQSETEARLAAAGVAYDPQKRDFVESFAAPPAADFAKLQARAAQGYAEAENALGGAYLRGDGVARDEAEADRWFAKAADDGHMQAETHLALSYLQGRGVARDAAAAVPWLRRAAADGYAPAAGLLGRLFEAGNGLPQDDAEAYFWYNVAAERTPGLSIERDRLAARLDDKQRAGVDPLIRDWLRDHPSVEFPFPDARAQQAAEAAREQAEAADFAAALPLAQKGDAAAEEKLCAHYWQGAGVTPDYVTGFPWCLRAALRGNGAAQNLLGRAYNLGVFGRPNPTEGIKWLARAALQGVIPARSELAMHTDDDRLEALFWEHIPAEGHWPGSLRSLYLKAWALARRPHFRVAPVETELAPPPPEVQADPAALRGWQDRAIETAVNWRLARFKADIDLSRRAVVKDQALLMREGTRGNVGAQMAVARAYESLGAGAWGRDYADAARWYAMAAALGNLAGERSLGELYAAGHGVPKDAAAARAWLQKAADQGDAYAMADLRDLYQGNLYQGSRGTAADPAEAYFWYLLARANAAPPSALPPDTGDLTPQQKAAVEQRVRDWKPANAAGTLQAQATGGDARAQTGLGMQFQLGLNGVKQDFAQAAAWYEKAAARGDARAQSLLGVLYLSGRGVAADPARAYFWLSLAAPRVQPADAKPVREARDRAAGALDAGRKAAVDAEVRAWKPAPAAKADPAR